MEIRTGNVLSIRLLKPADKHEHFREGARLRVIAPLVAKRFYTAIAMPNLDKKPITTVARMRAYRRAIIKAAGPNFRPLMTLYLTDTLDPKQVELACEDPDFVGIKYYPAGLTTNSNAGVTNPAALWTPSTRPYECLKVLVQNKKVLLLHGADGVARSNTRIRTRQYAPNEELDPYDQEPHFIEHSLTPILEGHPDLKVSFEHISTAEGAEFMRDNGGWRLGCAMTPHHLLTDRRDTHRKGLRPHGFWFPPPQAKEHRDELRKFVAEGHPFVWLGSDSAPHYRWKKETDCCAGGVMTAHACIELYAEAFEQIGILPKLEEFASINGPHFYNIPPSKEYITLLKQPWKVKELYYVEEKDDVELIRPFRLGEEVQWQLAT